jgi:hypothetical protein
MALVIVANQKQVEKFTENADKNEVIRTAFRNYLARDPSEQEYIEYSKVMQNAGDTSTLLAAIKNSDSLKVTSLASNDQTFMLDGIDVYSSPLFKQTQDVDPQVRLKTYNSIIVVYNNVLDRMPSSKELAFYAYKLLKDKDFTLDKLRELLFASSEYKMLQKNQSNVVNSQLHSNITDQQITLEVRRLYGNVHGLNKIPEDYYEVYLKAKYIEYNLDDNRLTNLILLLREFDNQNFRAIDNIMKANASGEIVEGNNKSVQSNSSSKSGNSANGVSNNPNNNSSTKFANVTQSKNTDMNKSSNSNQSAKGIQSEKNSTTTCASTKSVEKTVNVLPGDTYYTRGFADYSDPFTLSYLQLPKSQMCSYSKENIDNSLQQDHRPQNQLAEAVQIRNRDNMNIACKMNNFFLEGEKHTALPFDMHEEYGTSILDSKKTYVGGLLQ